MAPNPAPVASFNDQLVLAELLAGREEIKGRSAAQNNLIALNITATGTLLGLSLAMQNSAPPAAMSHAFMHPLSFLLVLPIFSPLLGLLYLDHASTIRALGNHISALQRNCSVDCYETVARERARTVEYIFLFWVPVSLAFIVIPIIILFFLHPPFTHDGLLSWLGVLWGAGGCLSALFIMFSVRVLFFGYRSEPRPVLRAS